MINIYKEEKNQMENSDWNMNRNITVKVLHIINVGTLSESVTKSIIYVKICQSYSASFL